MCRRCYPSVFSSSANGLWSPLLECSIAVHTHCYSSCSPHHRQLHSRWDGRWNRGLLPRSRLLSSEASGSKSFHQSELRWVKNPISKCYSTKVPNNVAATQELELSNVEEKDSHQSGSTGTNRPFLSSSLSSSSQCSIYDYAKFPTAFFFLVYGCYFWWIFYKSDYQWSKAYLKIELHHRQFLHWVSFGTEHDNRAEKNARFESGLSPELTHWIAVYFLQLDLDKANGVRRSDILTILKEIYSTQQPHFDSFVLCKCGIENPEELNPVRNFVEAGRGRSLDVKRRSGCQLQEVIELFDELVGVFSISPAVTITRSDSFDPADFESKLLEELKRQTKGATKTIIPSNNVWQNSSLPGALSTLDEISDEEIIQLDIQRLKRMEDNFLEVQSRRGLTPSQKTRLLSIEKELQQLEFEISKIKSRQEIDKIKDTLHRM